MQKITFAHQIEAMERLLLLFLISVAVNLVEGAGVFDMPDLGNSDQPQQLARPAPIPQIGPQATSSTSQVVASGSTSGSPTTPSPLTTTPPSSGKQRSQTVTTNTPDESPGFLSSLLSSVFGGGSSSNGHLLVAPKGTLVMKWKEVPNADHYEFVKRNLNKGSVSKHHYVSKNYTNASVPLDELGLTEITIAAFNSTQETTATLVHQHAMCVVVTDGKNSTLTIKQPVDGSTVKRDAHGQWLVEYQAVPGADHYDCDVVVQGGGSQARAGNYKGLLVNIPSEPGKYIVFASAWGPGNTLLAWGESAVTVE